MKARKLWAAVVAIVLLAIVATVAGARQPAPASAVEPRAGEVVLTVQGLSSSVDLTMDDLKAMTAYSGYAGMKNSAGTLFGPFPVKGVSLTDLLALVGGINEGTDVTILGVDNYGMTYTYDQIANQAWTTYDPVTGATVAPTATLTPIIGYEQDGQPLGAYPTGEGPLRMYVAQPSSAQVVDGHLLVKWVRTIKIEGAKPDWTVKLSGLLRNGKRQTATLDRSSYLSCAAPGCHGASWTDAKGREWTGVPLFLIVGKVDFGKSHDYGAYNEALALKGYRVKLVNKSGRVAYVGSRLIRNRGSILLANKVDGEELADAIYPLRLVGPRLTSSQKIGGLDRIRLVP